MIRKDGPGFEVPAKVAGDRKQALLQHRQSVAISEVMILLVGSSGYDVRTTG
jgi:hypothetical protein